MRIKILLILLFLVSYAEAQVVHTKFYIKPNLPPGILSTSTDLTGEIVIDTSGVVGTGTVTSVNGSGGTTGLTLTGGPITTAGTLTLGGVLAIANGGTNASTANSALNNLLPNQSGNAGKFLTTNGTDASWVTAAGTGTVTSVALTAPSEISVSGSPITTSGTFALTWANQTTNKVFASPNGSTGTPAFRALVAADIPSLGYVTSVGLTMPSIFSVSGSPVTSSGTLGVTLTTQSANRVFAGPVSGGAATPTFRALVAADMPFIPSGLVNWYDSLNTTSPNTAIPVVSFTAKNAASDVDAAIEPINGGSFSLRIADATFYGGNKRGWNAVDLQIFRASPWQVASGIQSFLAGGESNVAAGTYDVVVGSALSVADGGFGFIGGGEFNYTHGQFSSIISGYQDTTLGDYSSIMGGSRNRAAGLNSFIAGGDRNKANGDFSAIIGGVAMSLDGDNNLGFLAGNSSGVDSMRIARDNIVTLGNADLWLANNDNAARRLMFFAPNNTVGLFDSSTTKYVGFKAGVVTSNRIYTWPLSDGSANQVLSTNGSGVLSWIGAGSGGIGTVTSVSSSLSGITITNPTTTPDITGTLDIANGGTGKTTANSAFRALSPMATLGDMIYADVLNTPTRLPGNTTTTLQVLTQTGVGGFSAAPVWMDADSIGGGVTGFANPTALIGMSTINGAATTAMRSDAAPRIDPAINPTWTGIHGFSDSVGSVDVAQVNLQTSASAHVGAQEYSPFLSFSGAGWKTNATAGSEQVIYRMGARTVQGTAHPTGLFAIESFVTGGSYIDNLTLSNSGVLTLGSPLQESSGGTHQSTYATGDLLYASASNTLSKLAIGSTGNVLTVSGGVPTWVVPTGTGLVNIVETLNSSAPNGTVKVEELKVSGASTSTDNDLSLVPKGVGAFMLATPDNGTVGGNKRGVAAVDLQMGRAAASQVASGAQSFIGGGLSNTASGQYSVALGAANIASSQNSIAIGIYANSDKLGQLALSSGRFNNAGDMQISDMGAATITTNATSNIELLLGRSDHITMSNNTAWTFNIMIVGKQSSSTNYASYTITGSVVRGANAASTVVNGVTTNTIVDNIGVAAVPSVIANTTNGGINIVVTGKAATTINWVARLETVEVTL